MVYAWKNRRFALFSAVADIAKQIFRRWKVKYKAPNIKNEIYFLVSKSSTYIDLNCVKKTRRLISQAGFPLTWFDIICEYKYRKSADT